MIMYVFTSVQAWILSRSGKGAAPPPKAEWQYQFSHVML